MTAPNDERMKELRGRIGMDRVRNADRVHLFALLDAFPAMRGELEKVKGENERLRGEFKKLFKMWQEQEAEAEAARPLLEAVMETDIFQYHDPDTDCPIIRAALALRQRKEKGE